VWVADDGKGIAPEEQSRIFDRFYQVDSSSRRSHGGMGLGLAIVREILEAHGTTIQVESAPGRGTTFRFTLPVRVPPADGSGGSGDRGGSVKLSGSAAEAVAGDHRRRVLLIDDDPGFAGVVSHFLERRGFSVETATSAEEGWRRARRRHLGEGRAGEGVPDVILLDRLLPDADGFDLLARLKEDEATAHVPVLMVSIRREKALGQRLGASGYLAKPVDPERLLAAVRGALRAHRHRSRDGASREGAGHLARVLVVDDEPDLRDLLSRRLLADGFAVDTAADGPEALEMIREAPPDLLLLDLMMPGMDGWELLRRLRDNSVGTSVNSVGTSEGACVGAELPVIVITARDSREDRQTGEQLGVLETVTKPFDLAELVAQIEQTLANSGVAITGDRA
jgi:DNA-binding response OmpR family regulator